MTAERIVIAGAGVAGLRAAERFRELGFDGDLLIIGDERHHPYHRPALSGQALASRRAARQLDLARYVELGDCWRLDTRLTGLEPSTHTLFLPGGENLHYDGLVVATGLQARHLPGAPRRDPRVHVLRTLDDASRIRATLAGDRRGRVLVVGTGFIGCEVAATVRTLDRDVTIIGRSRVLMRRALGPAAGSMITNLHRRNDTELALGAVPTRWHRGPDRIVVELSDGRVLSGTCVVLAVGGVFATDWLHGSGLAANQGVVCEPTCFVRHSDCVVAAGDVACWPNLRVDGTPRSCPHWLNAVEMGRAAAESLLAGRSRARPYCPLPRFWSDQYGLRLQAIGSPELATRTVRVAAEGWPGQPVFACYRYGRWIGAVAVDQPHELLRLSRELEREFTHPAKPVAGRFDEEPAYA